jgi:hypothetical protein
MPDAQPIAVAAPRVVASVSHHHELLRAIRDRVAELGITHETLDAVAGLQSDYASKLLADPPLKHANPYIQFILFQALGMKLQAVEDPEAFARVRSRLVKREVARVMPSRSPHRVIRFEITPDRLRQMQIRGGRNCMAKCPQNNDQHSPAKQRMHGGAVTSTAREGRYKLVPRSQK